MELKILFTITFTIACAQCAAVTSVRLQKVNSTRESNDFSIIIPSEDYTNKDDITFTPALVIVGKNNGEMVRCLNKRCKIFNTAGSAITSIVTSGAYIFAGLSSGVMWRCSLHNPDACTNFNTAGSSINALAITGGYIYAALACGTIWRCEIDQENSCSTYYTANSAVTSLAASDTHIFAGLTSGKMIRCSVTKAYDCFLLNTASHSITTLLVAGDYVYAGMASGIMWKCKTVLADSCTVWNTVGSAIKSLSIFNKTIYAATDSDLLMSCKLDKKDSCSDFDRITGALSIANVYGTFQIQSRVKNEYKQCSWQKQSVCPPFVVYFDMKEASVLEVHIRDGKVYNSQGILFDTKDADYSHSSLAAIFVMGPDGQILISNPHKIYLLHHSSFLAGNPVSGAGEIIIGQGVIKKITTCSAHYRPNLDLNRQVIDALYLKGYTAQIDLQLCPVKMLPSTSTSLPTLF